MAGTKACTPWAAPQKLTSISRFQAARSRATPPGLRPIAGVVHQNRRDAELGLCERAQVLDLTGAGDIGGHGKDARGTGRDGGEGALGRVELLARQVGHHDVQPRAGEGRGGGQANAAGRAGDDRRAAWPERRVDGGKVGAGHGKRLLDAPPPPGR